MSLLFYYEPILSILYLMSLLFCEQFMSEPTILLQAYYSIMSLLLYYEPIKNLFSSPMSNAAI
jgi:hypothetical protein